MDFEHLGRDETSAPHDQFGAARPVVLQMQFDLAVDHVALALAYRGHVGLNGTSHRAELTRVMRQMRDLRTPDLILAGHAGDVGTGPANPAALDDSRTPPGLRHVPGQQLAALAAAENQNIDLFWRHRFLITLPLRLPPTLANCGGAE